MAGTGNTEIQVRRFVSERLVPGGAVRLDELYSVYQAWCEHKALRPSSRVRICRMLTRHMLIPAALGNKGIFFKGMQLKKIEG